jgi:hypothetical protein
MWRATAPAANMAGGVMSGSGNINGVAWPYVALSAIERRHANAEHRRNAAPGGDVDVSSACLSMSRTMSLYRLLLNNNGGVAQICRYQGTITII